MRGGVSGAGGRAPHKPATNYAVLLYVPNIIGYVRLALVTAALVVLPGWPAGFVVLYSVSITLDGLDGYAARKLNQCSLFGAWFDVVLDNIGRGLLWSHIHPLLYLVSAVEWVAFVCNYSHGAQWREKVSQDPTTHPPPFVKKTMANNFRNRWGVWAIAGLHVLPVWLLGIKHQVFASHLAFLPRAVQPAGVLVLGSGRVLCLAVELWTISQHVRSLLTTHH